MPKMKTSRAAAKRFKKTGSGKLKRNKAYKSHILTKKSQKRKRNLRKAAMTDATNVKPFFCNIGGISIFQCYFSFKKSFLSMGFSLALVICVLLFIFGFKHFLKGREYQGNAVQKEAESSTQDIHKEYLDTDKTFQSGYIMIKDVPEKGIYTSKLPGEKRLFSGFHILIIFLFFHK